MKDLSDKYLQRLDLALWDSVDKNIRNLLWLKLRSDFKNKINLNTFQIYLKINERLKSVKNEP